MFNIILFVSWSWLQNFWLPQILKRKEWHQIIYIYVKSWFFLLPKNIDECIEKKTAHKTKESYRSSYDKKSHCFKISQISQIIFAQSWVNCMGFFHFVAWHFKWMSYYNVMDSAIVVGGGVRGNWLALRMCIGGIFRISARGISKKGLICIFSLNNCAVLHGQQKAIKYR